VFAKLGRSTYAPRKPSARMSRTANCHSLRPPAGAGAGAELPYVINNFPVREAGDDIHTLSQSLVSNEASGRSLTLAMRAPSFTLY
jgi:hypothetical protein